MGRDMNFFLEKRHSIYPLTWLCFQNTLLKYRHKRGFRHPQMRSLFSLQYSRGRGHGRRRSQYLYIRLVPSLEQKPLPDQVSIGFIKNKEVVFCQHHTA